MDSGLNIAGTVKFLKENDLPLPSLIKNESYKTIKSHQKKAELLLNDYRYLLINKADFKIRRGINKAVAKKKEIRILKHWKKFIITILLANM